MANNGNHFMIAFIKSPLGGVFGKGLAVITLKGIKTGRQISVPINVIDEGDSFTVISLRERTWWRNLRGGAKVGLFTGGKNLKASGSVLESQDEVRAALALFFTRHANMAKFFKVTFNKNGSINELTLVKVVSERVVITLKKELSTKRD
ncbi:MAG: hypothetical protein CVU42_01065 [Chloroflexi bacterium HGW-Chloroflexi-4]|jgi:hypothetical protein|nr:MAG: hypothetical protein CVU42_01065 [Chloroflexi bacterium HGW-Chloroflexi-4]